MIKEHIAQLMDKEMDRKAFLVHAAAAAVAVVGATTVLKVLSQGSPSSVPTSPKAASAHQFGYGAAPYGR